MQLQIESTDEVVILQEVEHRVWRGVTPYGVECQVLVRRIAVREGEMMDEFESDPHLQVRPQERVKGDNPFCPF
jgi:hypothetical protein